ncbi:MFS transporter [Paenibacillus sp. IHBB 3054]|uniref:MFS transporter n=1 Tax=Paenibacillus sp. IHBB 3054 TaxID=3425689 RepID=UPI003F666D5C
MHIYFSNRQFRQIATANIFSTIGDKMYYLAMLTFVSTLPNAQLAIGLVTASELIPQLFSSYTGYRADQTHKVARNLIWADLIRVGLYFIVGLLFCSSLEKWIVLIGIVILNFLSDFTGSYASGLRLPLIVKVTGKEDYPQASGFNQGISQIVGMISQFVTASLLIVVSYSFLAWTNAASFLFSGFIMLSFFRRSPQFTTKAVTEVQQGHKGDGYFKNLKVSFAALTKENKLFGVILAIIVLNAMLSSLTPLIQMIIVSAKKEMVIYSYPFTIAVLSTVISLSLAAGGLLGTKILKQMQLQQLVMICLVFTTIFYPALLLKNMLIILPMLAPVCFLVGTIVPKLSGWIVSVVEENKLATTIGIINTLLVGLAPLTTFLLVTISAAASPILTIAILFVSSLALMTFQIKSGRVNKSKQHVNLQ